MPANVEEGASFIVGATDDYKWLAGEIGCDVLPGFSQLITPRTVMPCVTKNSSYFEVVQFLVRVPGSGDCRGPIKRCLRVVAFDDLSEGSQLVVRSPLSVVRCQWSVVSGPLSVVRCQWSVVSGPLSFARFKQLTTDNGLRTTDYGLNRRRRFSFRIKERRLDHSRSHLMPHCLYCDLKL